MNPNQNPNILPQQGPELPAPTIPAEAPTNRPLEAPPRPAEKAPAKIEQKSSTVDRQPTTQPQSQNTGDDQVLQQPAQQQPQPTINQITQDNNPVIADDIDVIEKEWVNKAKDVVKKTSSDPFEQERQVSKLQADYLKKRYNKDIKIPND